MITISADEEVIDVVVKQHADFKTADWIYKADVLKDAIYMLEQLYNETILGSRRKRAKKVRA